MGSEEHTGGQMKDTVILRIFGVVLFSLVLVVNGFTEIKAGPP